MKYFYARVSTKEQNLGRQEEAFKAYGEADLFISEKQSGKNFEDRAEYQKMKSMLKQGDSVVVLSLDRLGRNYDEIGREWQWFRDNGIGVKVLDMDVLDTTKDNDLTSKLIADITLNLLSYVAENEREKILSRQKQGHAAMKVVDGKRVSSRTGGNFGVAPIPCPDFPEYYDIVKSGAMSIRKASEELGISTSKWYRLCKYHEARLAGC